MRVTNVEAITNTARQGVFDLEVTVAGPRGRAQKLPFTYNPGDTSELTLAVGEWLTKHKIEPRLVAAPYVPPVPTIGSIKLEASRRIEELWPVWKQVNVMRAGDQEAINLMGAQIDAIRQKSRALETLLPPDYRDQKYWV